MLATLLRVCHLTSSERPPSTLPAFGSCPWAVPIGQSTPLRLGAGIGFSIAQLPRTASPSVNHMSGALRAAWPTASLAIATLFPADPAVKSRNSEISKRQESLIQRAHMRFCGPRLRCVSDMNNAYPHLFIYLRNPILGAEKGMLY